MNAAVLVCVVFLCIDDDGDYDIRSVTCKRLEILVEIQAVCLELLCKLFDNSFDFNSKRKQTVGTKQSSSEL